MDSRVGARVIRRLVTLDKKMHAKIASYHRMRAEKLMAIWKCVVDRAAQETFGRSLKFGEYKVCAIACSEFSDRHKRILRHCAYRSTEHLDCAASHDILARRG